MWIILGSSNCYQWTDMSEGCRKCLGLDQQVIKGVGRAVEKGNKLAIPVFYVQVASFKERSKEYTVNLPFMSLRFMSYITSFWVEAKVRLKTGFFSPLNSQTTPQATSHIYVDLSRNASPAQIGELLYRMAKENREHLSKGDDFRTS